MNSYMHWLKISKPIRSVFELLGSEMRKRTFAFRSLYVARKNYIRKEWVLLCILLLAFFLRAVGVGYGLPLSVVYDEAPYTLGALLMIKLHTILPSLHAADFQTVLYYPPYISYVLLAPFVAILGLQYLLWSGDPALFQYHILQDLSPFFIAARLLNVLLGTLSVFLVYRITESLFRSRVAAAAAAFLLATSVLHIALSMVGRQWVPVGTVLLIVLYLLLKGEWSLKKRYLTAFFAAGIGMGISSISALAVPLIGVHYLCFGAPRLRNILRDTPLFFIGTLIFFTLAALAWLLYHSGNTFTGSITLYQSKSLIDLLVSPWSALSTIFFSEPVLSALAVLGLGLFAFKFRKVGLFLAAFFIVYIVVFYVLFRFEARFVLPLIPFLAIAGGYAVATLVNRRGAVLVLILLALPLFVALRLSYLSVHGETHQSARTWALENLRPDDKVLVYSSALHVPTQKAAVTELRSIDPRALHKVDEADEAFDDHTLPHVLNNLTSLIGTPFTEDLPQYARLHEYEYLILEPRSLPSAGTTTQEVFASMIKDATEVARFDGFGYAMSLDESQFREWFTVLFQHKLLGSDIVIYRLH